VHASQYPTIEQQQLFAQETQAHSQATLNASQAQNNGKYNVNSVYNNKHRRILSHQQPLASNTQSHKIKKEAVQMRQGSHSN
jgi:hypothetical protein|tara:strand:+ start:383 stop:628 length:246 start_codon:yes stop_codon:yes gene_type:complete